MGEKTREKGKRKGSYKGHFYIQIVTGKHAKIIWVTQLLLAMRDWIYLSTVNN